ncbi:latrophilin-like protein 1 [Mytilus californianus]|uniref:latrophilin-like protein 1 n=1 Tax=Mytilus californianus TaxID=6549 RepID=UPI0022484ACB|nr:latrophilin-like protein 1 [Mytilus californianus]
MIHATLFQFIWIFMINLSAAEVLNSIQHKYFIACGDTIMRLNCSSTDDILRIIGASYGRFTSFLCRPNSWPTPSSEWDLQCSARRSFAIAAGRCDGKPSCTLKASTTLFGDPCRTTPKYLDVLYRCVEQTGSLKNSPQMPTTLPYLLTLIHKITTPMVTESSSPMITSSSEIVSIAETCNEDRSNISVSVEVFAGTLTAIVSFMTFIIVILVIYSRSKLRLLKSYVAQNTINTVENTRYLALNRGNIAEPGYSSLRSPDYLELY